MATEIEGRVYAYESNRRVVAIQTGLTPKVIRFTTDQDWAHGERVVVRVYKQDEVEDFDPVQVEGYVIA